MLMMNRGREKRLLLSLEKNCGKNFGEIIMTWKNTIKKAPVRLPKIRVEETAEGKVFTNQPNPKQMRELFEFFRNDDSVGKDETIKRVKSMQGGPNDLFKVMAVLKRWPKYYVEAENKIINDLEELMEDFDSDNYEDDGYRQSTYQEEPQY